MAGRKKPPPRKPNRRISAQAASTNKRKRKRRGKRTLHYLLLLLFVLAAGVVLSLTVFFSIGEVRVVGLDKYSPEAVIAASGIEVGENMLRLDTSDIAERLLEEFPYLETVRVRRKFPPAIELEVTQSTPMGAVVEDSKITLINREGKLLEQGDVLIPTEVPVILGLDLAGLKPGDYVAEENLEKLVMLQYLFDAAEENSFGTITNVDVSDRLNMRMVYEARLVVLLGSESDMDYKLTFLQAVIDDLGPDTQARIDVTNVANKRILVKFGIVENGEFTATGASVYDQTYNLYGDSTVRPGSGSRPPATSTPSDDAGSGAEDTGGDEVEQEGDEPVLEEEVLVGDDDWEDEVVDEPVIEGFIVPPE